MFETDQINNYLNNVEQILMSNHYPKILLKMNYYIHHVYTLFEQVMHPAAGKLISEKKKKRTSVPPFNPRATPDSRNIREVVKRQDSFRRSPAP
jgi:hypothetical protein